MLPLIQNVEFPFYKREEERTVNQGEGLRNIFWPTRDGVTGESKLFHNIDYHNSYSLPNTVRMIISRTSRKSM
jgi:hypothetical protein